jgi:hypothetical protein
MNTCDLESMTSRMGVALAHSPLVDAYTQNATGASYTYNTDTHDRNPNRPSMPTGSDGLILACFLYWLTSVTLHQFTSKFGFSYNNTSSIDSLKNRQLSCWLAATWDTV